jgi:hypothetical protein
VVTTSKSSSVPMWIRLLRTVGYGWLSTVLHLWCLQPGPAGHFGNILTVRLDPHRMMWRVLVCVTEINITGLPTRFANSGPDPDADTGHNTYRHDLHTLLGLGIETRKNAQWTCPSFETKENRVKGSSRGRFTKEFKLAAVRRLDKAYRSSKLREGWRSTPTKHRWRREFRHGPGNAFPGNGRQRW